MTFSSANFTFTLREEPVRGVSADVCRVSVARRSSMARACLPRVVIAYCKVEGDCFITEYTYVTMT